MSWPRRSPRTLRRLVLERVEILPARLRAADQPRERGLDAQQPLVHGELALVVLLVAQAVVHPGQLGALEAVEADDHLLDPVLAQGAELRAPLLERALDGVE